MTTVTIRPSTPRVLIGTPLPGEAAAEGFRFIDRLTGQAQSGCAAFTATGEVFLAALRSGELVGVCGLARDCYGAPPGVARLRHLYVRPAWRGQGIGRRLVGEALAAARLNFSAVRLRTDTQSADMFYRALGFRGVEDVDATHFIAL
ncbi:MAG: GNAT family N-acetyltransferase [Oceanicaulis sp.]